jgi:hypothetical protein
MALPTYTLAADATTGAPAGDYVAAELALPLEQSFAKLVWAVLYGKAHDAQRLAVAAEQMLAAYKPAKAA